MHSEPACKGQGPVVYRIRNLFNGKKYVGSTMNCAARMYFHINRLRRNKSSSLKLQRAFNKHGEGAFAFEIAEHCTAGNLLEREQHYLNQRPEYNISWVAGPRTRYGLKSTEQHRANMSKALKGRTSPMKGKKFTDEHRRNWAAALKGKHMGTDHQRIDLLGQQFGRLTVVGYTGKNSRGEAVWHARCTCGGEKDIIGSVLRGGRSRSCGCLKRDAKNWRKCEN
jgi:group I intron endonuclease